MRRQIYTLAIFACISIGVISGLWIVKSRSLITPVIAGKNIGQNQVLGVEMQPTAAPASSPTTVGLPQTISIPKIGVSAQVEHVGMDSQGRMDIPKNSNNTAWYNLGPKPGEKGSAVIDGHLDKITGAPAVFWDLNKLVPGDQITVTDDQGQTHTFQVTQNASYPWDSFPIDQVFSTTVSPSDKPKLNLITCQGNWDANKHNYSNREVVYSELVN